MVWFRGVLSLLLVSSSIAIGRNRKELNNRPIIGIISQALPSSIEDLSPGGTYIAASYVKWIEAAGGRVVPLIAGSNQNFTQLFSYLNGVLFPGGAVSISSSPYASVGKEMFELAKAANDAGDYFPIWGTCLGFEMIVLLANNGERNLKRCESYNQHLPLDLLSGWEGSRLFREAGSDVLDALTSLPVTANFHRWCLTMENFTHYEMEKFWTPLSVNIDKEGLEFISTVEAKDYPFYGTQFHPEKNSFEFTLTYPAIPHTREGVMVASYLNQMFLQEARMNGHHFPSRAEEEAALIYNYSPVFSGTENIDSSFEQVYIFPKQI